MKPIVSQIWPEVNNLDFDLQELTRLKTRRNNAGVLPSSNIIVKHCPNGRVLCDYW